MKFKYVGDPSQGDEALPKTFTAYGVTFERDKFAEVPAALEGKFAGNSHFEVQGTLSVPKD